MGLELARQFKHPYLIFIKSYDNCCMYLQTLIMCDAVAYYQGYGAILFGEGLLTVIIHLKCEIMEQ